MSAGGAHGYRFSARYLAELERAVKTAVEQRSASVFAVAAAEYAHDLAVHLECPAGGPTDPPPAARSAGARRGDRTGIG
ncbi:hypothetical protein ABZY31_06820 [Streptomyces sp. NPDC006529]|uniref:hypothetical protein n=1 Tax=Streptomyces sp. NPDC006529 TaxID=3157177 RepID=UPI0033BCFFDD